GRRNLRDRQPARRADPAHSGPAMRTVAVPGRWVWGLSGLVTAAVLVVPGVRLATAPGTPWHRQPPPDTVTRSLTVDQNVTSMDVQSNGGSVQVSTGPVRHVRVTEAL